MLLNHILSGGWYFWSNKYSSKILAWTRLLEHSIRARGNENKIHHTF